MKRFLVILALLLLAGGTIFAVRHRNAPYSQARILSMTRKILENGEESRLERMFLSDRRVSFDTLVSICSRNISEFDTVRSAIFNSICEIEDPTILRLMSVKISSGNPIEKLIASGYIYRYYGVEMKFGQDMPLASLLVLFHNTAQNLDSRQAAVYRDVELKSQVAATFPESRILYREFILNYNLPLHVRTWFAESLPESGEREKITAFLQDLQKEISDEDPISGTVKDVIYTLTHRGAHGDWIIAPQ